MLKKEDYEEPCCPLQTPGEPTPIPVRRVIGKLDEYLNAEDYPSAERHLCYWLAEAEAGGDRRGKLTILNEQIGFYRKTGRADEALAAADAALALAEALDVGRSVTMGTTLVNAATAYKAFGRAAEALPLYERAQHLYEHLLPEDDGRLGGLYNNMALALADLGEYRRAEALYRRALDVMARVPGGEPDMAITCCNLADLVAAEVGQEAGEARIGEWLDRAEALLNAEGVRRDAPYAYVCERCAPTFGLYGYFLAERELTERAAAIRCQK